MAPNTARAQSIDVVEVGFGANGTATVQVDARSQLVAHVGPFDTFIVFDPSVVDVVLNGEGSLAITPRQRWGQTGIALMTAGEMRILSVQVAASQTNAALSQRAANPAQGPIDPDGLSLRGTAQWYPDGSNDGFSTTHSARWRQQREETTFEGTTIIYRANQSPWRLSNVQLSATGPLGFATLSDYGLALGGGLGGSGRQLRGLQLGLHATDNVTVTSSIGLGPDRRCCRLFSPESGQHWGLKTEWQPGNLAVTAGAGYLSVPTDAAGFSYGFASSRYRSNRVWANLATTRAGAGSLATGGLGTSIGKTGIGAFGSYKTTGFVMEETAPVALIAATATTTLHHGVTVGLSATDSLRRAWNDTPAATALAATASAALTTRRVRVQLTYNHATSRIGSLWNQAIGSWQATSHVALDEHSNLSAHANVNHVAWQAQRLSAAVAVDRDFSENLSAKASYALSRKARGGSGTRQTIRVNSRWHGRGVGLATSSALNVYSAAAASWIARMGVSWAPRPWTRLNLGVGLSGVLAARSPTRPIVTAGYAVDPELFRRAAALVGVRGSITGVVFVDRNGNDIQDAGEPPVPNAIVSVDGRHGTPTDAAGTYTHRRLIPGPHTIAVAADPSQLLDGRQIRHELSGAGVDSVDIGVSIRSTIAGNLYQDIDGDNTFGPADLGFSNLSVQLLDEHRRVVQTTISRSGAFRFTGVPPGQYIATPDPMGLPVGYEAVGSLEQAFTTPNGHHKANFILKAIRSVSGTVYLDHNGDGQRSGADEPIEGATVSLSDGRTTFTNARGQYRFRNVDPGAWVVRTRGALAPYTANFSIQPASVRRADLFVPAPESGISVADAILTPYRDPDTGDVVTDPSSGQAVVQDPDTGVPSLYNVATGVFSPWLATPTAPPAGPAPDVAYVDPATGAPLVDPATGRPVVVDPNTGEPAIRDDRQVLVPFNPQGADVAYVDPVSGAPVIDPPTGRPLIQQPGSTLPALRNPTTGAVVRWTPPPGSNVFVPYLDPNTGDVVFDPATGALVLSAPTTGVPSVVNGATGEATPWTPPGYDSLIDATTGRALTDIPTGLPVLQRANTSGTLVLIDPATGATTPWLPPVGVTPAIPFLDPDTGAPVIDDLSGQTVVRDPNTGEAATRDAETGALTPWTPPISASDFTPYLNPRTGEPVVDPVSGQAVLLEPATGRTLIIDPDSHRARVIVVGADATLTSLRIAPDNLILKVRASQQLSASASYSDRTSHDTTTGATWRSTNSAVAVVDASGHVSAMAVGFAEITATLEGVTSPAVAVEVVELPVVGLTIDPTELTIDPGARASLTAQAIYVDGSVADFTNSVRWLSSDPQVATVDRSGRLTGVQPGVARVRGEFQGITGFAATITVTDLGVQGIVLDLAQHTYTVGEAIHPVATAILPDGSTRDVTGQATWEAADRLIASTDRDGVFAARGSGETTITATWGSGRSAPVALRVLDQAPRGIALSGAPTLMLEGSTAPATATAIYPDGSAEDISRAAIWATDDDAVLRVATDGTLTALRSGSATVTASRAGVTSQAAAVTVASERTVRFTASPTSVNLSPGEHLDLRASADVAGAAFDVEGETTWTTSDPSTVTVDGAGVITAVGEGSARINARWAGIIAPAVAVDVILARPLAVIIDPLVTETVVGATLRLTGTGLMPDGSSLDLTEVAQWESANNDILGAGAPGVFTARAAGTVQISATSRETTAQPLVVRVHGSPVTSLALPDVTVAAGGFGNLVATATLSDGTQLDLTHAVAWRVSDPTVLSVGTNGTITGLTPGVSQVTARFADVSTSFRVTVE